MSNRIITRHGERTPLETDLEPYELGILKNGDTYSLYTGAPSGAPVLLTSTGAGDYNILTNKPTINGVTLTSGLNMSDFGAVTLSSTLAVTGDATLGSNLIANGGATFNDVVTLNSDIQCNGMLYIQNLSGQNVQLPFMKAFDGSNYTLGGIITTTSSTTNYMRLMSRSLTSEGMPTSPAYYEYYRLPSATTDMTASKTYNILTSKSAVTVAQGGTGATTVANAQTNLGIPHTWTRIWYNATPSNAFAAQTLSLNMTQYVMIFVSAYYNKDDVDQIEGGVLIPISGISSITGGDINCYASSYVYGRKIRVPADRKSLTFTNGFRNNSASSNYCIPAEIWGWK